MFGLVPFYGRRKGLGPVFSDIEKFMEKVFNEDLFWVPVFDQAFKTDIKETEREYIVEAELPGFEKEDINITFENNTLNISIRRDEVVDEKRDNFIRKERRTGRMERSFYLEGVDEEKISAKYKNGLLTVVLPKKEPGLKRSKNIPIE
jgi:HSP20 family protein